MKHERSKSPVEAAVSAANPARGTRATTVKRGRPRKANPSPDAIRMRKVYEARRAACRAGASPAVSKRSLAARSVRNYRGKKSFGYMGKKAHAYGVFADRLYSRPIMRVGCHVPNL